MRILPWLIGTGLLFSTFWFRKQQDAAQVKAAAVTEQLEAVMDSIIYFRAHHPRITDNWRFQEMERLGFPLELSDSVIEIHRIRWVPDQAFYFLIQVKRDSSVWLEYQHWTLVNLFKFTRESQFKVITAQTLPVSRETFDRFRQKLTDISFFDATKSTDYFSCFGTGSLQWEANIQNYGYLKKSTSCRQSVQLAEACEMIMRLVDDPVLQSHLDFAVDHGY
ncbi:MAG: hypothetical protein ABIO24_14085 [Saprospiraceae bacterium]